MVPCLKFREIWNDEAIGYKFFMIRSAVLHSPQVSWTERHEDRIATEHTTLS